MRAILIDPAQRTVTEIDTDGKLASLQALVGGYIEAVHLDDKHHCYVNEEGLFNEPRHFFLFAGAHQPLAGAGVILADTKGGNEAACTLSLDWIRRRVTFMGLDEARRWASRRR